MHDAQEQAPIAIGMDPQLKVVMRSLQELPDSRPQLGPHLNAIQSEELPALLRQPQCLTGLVGPQHGLVLRVHLTEAS